MYRVLYTVHFLQRVEGDVQQDLNTVVVIVQDFYVVQGTLHPLQSVERDVQVQVVAGSKHSCFTGC